MASQVGFDPGHEFARAEGLGDVVVAADLETQNAIDLVRPGGQKDHRRARQFAGLANLPAKIEAVLPRKHDVEHDQIGLPGFESCSVPPAPFRRCTWNPPRVRLYSISEASSASSSTTAIFLDIERQRRGGCACRTPGTGKSAAGDLRVDPRIMPVAPVDPQGVVAHRFDTEHSFAGACTSGTGWAALPGASAIVFGRGSVPCVPAQVAHGHQSRRYSTP